MQLTQDLIHYLYNLIAPTHLEDCKVLVIEDLASFDWSEHEEASCHGMIVMTPEGGWNPEWEENLWRCMKPGGHLLLAAPEDQHTGHSGACALEDKGYEVRDAILVAQEAGKLHYVPKPSQRERHAGCEHLKLRKREQESDSIDGEIEEPSWDDRNLHKGNVHPTVKSKDLMARLLQDVPPEATVFDPFMGSGSTALACLETGHNFIGTEKEEDYIEIADARVRYWDRANAGWKGATVESEAPSKNADRQEMDLEDLFDL